jgi:acyl-CoA thioester hydrolase
MSQLQLIKTAKADKFSNSPSKIFSLPVRVYYQDTDAGGVVYHSTYLDFMEYLRPALLDDLLRISVQAVELGRSRITISQQVMRDPDTLTRATVQVVCVGAESLKPVSLPAPLRHKLETRP